ncbi:glycosyltransferase family 4 protein [Pleomorphomonas koreensis]|uniref:glycosyltransferase family 4 protein n=1 Tax=Pleomorphomonas koreensis TaxID=257440 RepID=UPI000403BF84|nr:glycosyltransferase family 4 protein [Pleomorphomonas koreensis]
MLFLQRRAGRAGAQTCLFRLARADRLDGGRPFVVTAGAGWLTEACAAAGIPVETLPFPSSRSLAGRLWGIRLWAWRLAARLRQFGWAPTIVIGNDHQESLLTRALATALGVPSGVILRSSGMTGRDFVKYGCGRHDVVFAIGEDFLGRVRAFPGGEKARPLFDGLADEDFIKAPPLSSAFPECALVLGTPHPDKGWGDLLRALDRLPAEAPVRHLRLDFTAVPSDVERAGLGLDRFDLSLCRFLGHTDDFASRLAGYDLVINASRRETFGMAALEALAAGRVLISSRTGVIERGLEEPRLLFRPADVEELASVLADLPAIWEAMPPVIDAARWRLAETFGIAGALSLFRAGVALAPRRS